MLSLVCTLAHAGEFPVFGIIVSVTGSTQFVIDIKSSPDAKPERDQRIINVTGVRGLRQDSNSIYALERQILNRDVELSGCSRVPLAPDQLTCHVLINMGRSLNPAVNLAAMLSSWGLAQLTQPLATPQPSASMQSPAPSPAGVRQAPAMPTQANDGPADPPARPSAPEFKPYTPPPNLRRSTG